MIHINEVKEVIAEYQKINAGIEELEKMTSLLNLRKLELDQALEKNKSREKALIDKIVAETGKMPDYYKIMMELNEN